MNAVDLVKHEDNFTKTLTNSEGVKYTIIGSEQCGSSLITKIRPNFSDYYYTDKYTKTKIVIHSTIGALRGDLGVLTVSGKKMSVVYVIARNGAIYELFDPAYWSYHLGQGSIGGNEFNSQRSIGIELSNYGPLKRIGNSLETMYSSVSYTDANKKSVKTKRDVYCDVDQSTYYKCISPAFRGYQYFAAYTDKQYQATKDLVNYLSDKFSIEKTFLSEEKRFIPFDSDQIAKDYRGVCTHVNFRSSGKWDLGPDFDWHVIIPAEVQPIDIALPVAEPPKRETQLPVSVAPTSKMLKVSDFITRFTRPLLSRFF